MVVVVIIGVLAAIAMPTMIESRRDQRAYEDASSILELVRSGRTRAIGRGTATMVSFDVTNAGRGIYRMYEGVNPNPGGVGPNMSPRVSCASTIANAWDPNPPNSQIAVNPNGLNLFIDGMDMNGTPQADANIYSKIITYGLAIPGQNGGPPCAGTCNPGHVDICFTPAGRPFISVDVNPPTFSPATPFVGLVEIAVARLLNNQTNVVPANAKGALRHVFVPPSGIARISSTLL
jgi:type II secretory pathway pseudopilin PulG